MAKINICNVSKMVEASGVSILDAALEADLPFPHGCRNGTCGTCKSRLMDGKIKMGSHAPEALSARERENGLFLACRAQARTDVSLEWLGMADTALPPLRRFKAKVVSVRHPTSGLHHLQLEVLGEPLAFLAGQYAELCFGRLPGRPFSMANRPDEPILEFYIQKLSNGLASRYIQDHLKPGDVVRLKGPYGTAHLHATKGPILAIAGGSGIAPMRSIVRTALKEGHKDEIRLYIGVRDAPLLCLENELRSLSERYANFHFQPVLSAPYGITDHRIGLVHEAVADDIDNLADHRIYAAGPPAMVDAVERVAAARGATPDKIFADPFEPAAPGFASRFNGLIGKMIAILPSRGRNDAPGPSAHRS